MDTGDEIAVESVDVHDTGVEEVGAETAGAETAGVETTGAETTGARATGVEATGAETAGARATGVEATGAQADVETTGARERVAPAALWRASGPNLVVHGDNLEVLPRLPDGSFQLIAIDPPFNTGREQQRVNVRTTRSAGGSRVGFHGHRYDLVRERVTGYDDVFGDYWAFLEPRLEEAWRLLHPTGTLYVHLDYREVHYAKVLLDALFGRGCFLNEIVWAYDYGARTNKRWPAKHDTILVYVKDPRRYHFDNAEVDREPYMAPGLVTPEKVARGKLPTDVWWHTIVSPNGREKTGYPTQKPLGIVRRMVAASSRPGDWVLDFFAGSGTLGAAAGPLGRRFVLVDEHPEAIATMRRRLGGLDDAAPIEFRDARGRALDE